MARIKHTTFRPRPLIASERRKKPIPDFEQHRNFLLNCLVEQRKQHLIVLNKWGLEGDEQHDLIHHICFDAAPAMDSPKERVKVIARRKREYFEILERIKMKIHNTERKLHDFYHTYDKNGEKRFELDYEKIMKNQN
jgi:hypothetical protein